MAATLGGTMRAPLTAVVFAFGLTHDVNAFLPSLLACAVAYGFTVIVMPRSILTEKIARRGRHVYREYGVDPLERHHVDEVMTRTVIVIDGALPAGEVIRTYFGASQAHRAYPVVADEQLVGLVDREQLSRIEPEDLGKAVATLFTGACPELALPGETCRAVASRMAAFGLERLPVVEAAGSAKLVGIVTRSDLLKVTGHLYDEESRRERFFAWQGSSR
jgi:CBS domain-containing protein